MQFVPVIDILGGEVVRGAGGRRDEYRPVRSRLCDGADAGTVVAAFLALFPFQAVYMADLDAIEHGRPNVALVEGLLARFPGLEIWLDAGFAEPAALRPWRGAARVRPVLGSESQAGRDDLLSLLAEAGEGAVLSLDFRGEDFVGPPAVWAQPADWPARLIAMTLEAVGGSGGPSLGRLREVIGRAGPGHAVYAAGGLRDTGDARALAATGCAGVLLASALHDGRLDAAAIRSLSA